MYGANLGFADCTGEESVGFSGCADKSTRRKELGSRNNFGPGLRFDD